MSVNLLTRYGLSRSGPVATFPTVAATSTSQMADQTTTHTVDLPTGIVNGSLVVVHWANASQTLTVTPPAGWTNIAGTSGIYRCFTRVCDGTEGPSITVTTSGARRSIHIAVRYENHFATSPFEGDQNSGVLTPPSHTASWGSDTNLWVTAIASDQSSGNDYTWTAPASYTGLIQLDSYIDAGSAHCNMAVAFRELETATEQPGAWSNARELDISLERAATYVVRPA